MQISLRKVGRQGYDYQSCCAFFILYCDFTHLYVFINAVLGQPVKNVGPHCQWNRPTYDKISKTRKILKRKLALQKSLLFVYVHKIYLFKCLIRTIPSYLAPFSPQPL